MSFAKIAKTARFEQPRRGDSVSTSGGPVTEDDVLAFARLIGDDRDHGVSPSGDPVVPGTLTLALMLALARDALDGAATLVGLDDVVFARPVAIGDALTVDTRIASLGAAAGAGKVTAVLSAANQRGQRVCRARARLLWRREHTARPSTGGG